MSPSDEKPGIPDVTEIAESTLVLYRAHDDHDDEPAAEDGGLYRPASREPLFPVNPEQYEAMRAATARDSDQYLHAGLTPVACGHCGASVEVKLMAPGYTAVQWDSASLHRCTYFAEQVRAGQNTSRTRGCPHLSASIQQAADSGRLGLAPDPTEDLD